MNTRSTLNNAILNFAFTGVMQPHQPEAMSAYARFAEVVAAAREKTLARVSRRPSQSGL